MNAKALESARRRHPQTSAWLDAWQEVATRAGWHDIVDVRKSFPSADGIKLSSGTVVTVFNVRGNKYRMLTTISYRLQLVAVIEVLTHAEYDKGMWKGQI